MDIDLLYYVLARCDVYLKLEGVTIEKSNRATLTSDRFSMTRTWEMRTGRFTVLLQLKLKHFFDATVTSKLLFAYSRYSIFVSNVVNFYKLYCFYVDRRKF